MTIIVSEKAKRSIDCPECGAKKGRACRGSRIPGANTFGGGWGGPPDLERSHAARRAAVIARSEATAKTPTEPAPPSSTSRATLTFPPAALVPSIGGDS